jgi:anaerobic magnesium-protoporphyrin IX monomethyl ester cyclase
MLIAPPPSQILLLKPESFAFSASPPLGLMALAASLRDRGFSARVLDLGFAEDVTELEARVTGAPPLLIGITSTTPEFPEAIRLVRRLRARFAGAPIVLGGVHASALGAQAVEEASVDYGARGEGEETLSELAAHLAEGRPDKALSGIRGLVYRDGGALIESPPRPATRDVDTLPFPAWDLIRAERYFVRPWHFLQERARSAFVMSSRGCPFGCTFCASHATLGKRFRARSPGLVVDEIEHLYRAHGVEEILFIDDNFTFDRDRTAAICEEILRRGLDISWRTPNGVRIDTLDEPLVRLMRRSGCYLLGFGIESGDPRILARTGKRLDLGILADRVAMVRRHGIITFGYFILGLPGETFRSGLKTVRLAARSELDLAHFGLFAPYPGSETFDQMRDRPGMHDWERYLFIRPFPGADMAPAEQKALLRLSYPAFYLHPRRARLLASVMSPRQLLEAARTLYHYMV